MKDPVEPQIADVDEAVVRRIRLVGSLAEAVAGAGLVQENARETPDAKRQVAREIDAVAPAQAALVKYEYTATINSLYEINALTGSNTEVDTSHLAGSAFAIGDGRVQMGNQSIPAASGTYPLLDFGGIPGLFSAMPEGAVEYANAFLDPKMMASMSGVGRTKARPPPCTSSFLMPRFLRAMSPCSLPKR